MVNDANKERKHLVLANIDLTIRAGGNSIIGTVFRRTHSWTGESILNLGYKRWRKSIKCVNSLYII